MNKRIDYFIGIANICARILMLFNSNNLYPLIFCMMGLISIIATTLKR